MSFTLGYKMNGGSHGRSELSGSVTSMTFGRKVFSERNRRKSPPGTASPRNTQAAELESIAEALRQRKKMAAATASAPALSRAAKAASSSPSSAAAAAAATTPSPERADELTRAVHHEMQWVYASAARDLVDESTGEAVARTAERVVMVYPMREDDETGRVTMRLKRADPVTGQLHLHWVCVYDGRGEAAARFVTDFSLVP